MENNNKFTISYVYADKPYELNTSIHRMFTPAKALRRKDYGISLIPMQLFQENRKDAEEAILKSHVIVVERNLIGDILTQMVYWVVRSRVVIVNFDDFYDGIEETNISYPYWHDGIVKTIENGEEKILNIFPHPLWQFKFGLKMCHAQTLASKELVKFYGQYSPSYLIPNYFEVDKYINIPKEKRDYITIGWGGSVSHLQSYRDSGVLKALKNVINSRSNVKIMICGDKRIYDILEIPENRKIFQPYVPYEQWGSIVAKKFDIGLAPLAGRYDDFRSSLKLIEYGLTKTPNIVTDNLAYHDYPEYGSKMIQNGEDNWTKSILETIDNLEEEKNKMSGDPYQNALKMNVDLHAEEIAELYRKIALKHANINLYGNEIPKDIKLNEQ